MVERVFGAELGARRVRLDLFSRRLAGVATSLFFIATQEGHSVSAVHQFRGRLGTMRMLLDEAHVTRIY